MRWAAQAALAGLFVAGFTADAFCATAQEGSAAPKESAKPEAAAPSLDSIVGKKFVSIDGSLITLSASEGVLAREIVSANGAVQKSNFRFINDRLGTVSDARDNAKVVGVFRSGQSDINVQYADGTVETLLANTGGGVSLETRAPAGVAYCTAWYPEGHDFSTDERKAALAQYASRLGLADGGDKAPVAHGCNSAAPTPPADTTAKKTDAPKADAGKPAVLASAAGAAGAAGKAAPKTADVAANAAAHAIDVRTSEVHTIDAPLAAGAVAASAAGAVAATAVKTDAKTDAPAPQKLASLEQPAAETLKGASGCLSVESDGSHWGFKNKCGYTVQFAYCLMGANALASCRDGAVVGSVAGNGFGALVTDESLKETDAAHDFRWVACQGGAGEVIPHLDETNPPSGRCVR